MLISALNPFNLFVLLNVLCRPPLPRNLTSLCNSHVKNEFTVEAFCIHLYSIIWTKRSSWKISVFKCYLIIQLGNRKPEFWEGKNFLIEIYVVYVLFPNNKIIHKYAIMKNASIWMLSSLPFKFKGESGKSINCCKENDITGLLLVEQKESFDKDEFIVLENAVTPSQLAKL